MAQKCGACGSANTSTGAADIVTCFDCGAHGANADAIDAGVEGAVAGEPRPQEGPGKDYTEHVPPDLAEPGSGTSSAPSGLPDAPMPEVEVRPEGEIDESGNEIIPEPAVIEPVPAEDVPTDDAPEPTPAEPEPEVTDG